MARPDVKPLIGITCDLTEREGRPRAQTSLAYASAVTAAGATPVLLPPVFETLDCHLGLVDGLVLTGGDDPRTEAFGEPTHPKAVPIHPGRQAYEVALLQRLESRCPDLPVLGVCLGMQLMVLLAGGRLNQHLPETCRTAKEHWDAEHAIALAGRGDRPGFLDTVAGHVSLRVHSRHRQAVESGGRLEPCAWAHDGLIEAVFDPGRRFYCGVQWHPERTSDPRVGQHWFDALAAASRPLPPTAC
ncbi:MAG: gamma-glutamyl-gamma-aminobutyrate hydrolase family protein [Phycisphaeraceae bacterium]|nr:gamma-glutamyl-gamma-aminobutyrate hydrolase family protein [Phycisphaeraceae bacterium]